MTWTLTERDTGDNPSGSADVTSASFTPSANSLLVTVIRCDNTINGVTGHGTWSLINSSLNNPKSGHRTELWGCRIGGSPSAASVVIDRDYTSDFSYQILDITHTSGLNGSTVADAHGTAGAQQQYASGGPTTITATLAAFADSNNLTFVTGAIQNSYDGADWNTDTGYTELSEWDSASLDYSCGTHYQTSEDTSPSMIFAGNFDDAGIVAVEIKQSAQGRVWVNDAPTLDAGAVEQTYPGAANWSDTSIDMQDPIDTTGLSGQLYVIVETAAGDIASRAVTVGGVTITDVNTTETWDDGDTGLVITGTGFV